MLRARFVVLPLVLLGVPAAYLGTLSVSEAFDDRAAAKREREYDRRVAPAVNVLGAVRVEGLHVCESRAVLEHLCLSGVADVRRTAASIERVLRDAGASDLTSRCYADGSVCTFQGTLDGTDLNGLVSYQNVAGKPTTTVKATGSAMLPLPDPPL